MTWQRGQSGNPSGRKRGETPRGAFRRQVEAALPTIVDKLLDAALGGDIAAAKLILDRVLPPLRATDERIKLALPNDPTERGETVVRAVAAGEMTPTQGATLVDVLDGARVLSEHYHLMERLEAIEEWLEKCDGSLSERKRCSTPR